MRRRLKPRPFDALLASSGFATYEHLAERAGIDPDTVADLARGRTRKPHRRVIRGLVAALQLPEAVVLSALAEQGGWHG